MVNIDSQHTEFHVTQTHDGQRLDRVLCDVLGLSRTQVKRLLESSAVRHNNRPANTKSKGHLLSVEDVLWVDMSHLTKGQGGPEECIVGEVGVLDQIILEQIDDVIVVNKPAGMPVHPLKLGEVGTVLNAIVAQYPQVQGVGEGGLRSGVVHRLDVTTSGVLAVAITQKAWEEYRQAFSNHETEKVYLALVQGHVPNAGELKSHLAVTQHKPAKVTTVDADTHDSRLCDMRFELIEHLHQSSLIKVWLGTGFLHQIRAMMSDFGHPLLGDMLYGGPKSITRKEQSINIYRPMLHAESLSVGQVNVKSRLPDDMQAIIDLLSCS